MWQSFLTGASACLCTSAPLHRQSMLTNHLIKCLDKRVRDAKSAGDFDIGIQTLTGNNVSVKKTRAFNFRGSEAKDESVLVHSVVIDRGMSSDAALKVYGEAIQADQRGSKIQTGFYIDGRALFKQCTPVYLVLSLGRTSPNAVVVRPNDGRTCFNIDHVMSRFVQPSLRCDDMAKVRKTWDAEFALANIGSDEYYQKWSKGRHRKPTHIFGGKIVPVINKLLTATLPRRNDPYAISISSKEMTLPKIVRIEIGSIDEVTEGSGASTVLSPDVPDDDVNVDVANEPPAVGQKVARKIHGGTIFRGQIVECTSNNSYVTEFTDGKRIEMDGEELRESKKLFAAELMKLTKANVSKTDAASTKVYASDLAKTATQARPLWTETDDIPDDCERAYEVEFVGDVPKLFIGLEFPEKKEAKSWNYEMLQLWKYVLRNLAERNLEDGIETPAKLFGQARLK
mmetsp:Transcript_13958/g.31777  ORF Transcript_13958/g.31777 Transcript_13958/m.31777 type:complete len:455 (-) Transcript_13958:79-1443(-)